MIVVYSLPIKAIIHEKFGDGIMSAIDFRASVESQTPSPLHLCKPGWLTVIPLVCAEVEDPAGDRVKITFDGKFLPYRKW